MKKFVVLAVIMVCVFSGSAWCAAKNVKRGKTPVRAEIVPANSESVSVQPDVVSVEREGMILRSEFNRLGNSGDPFEREAVLRKIIDQCEGTEEGEMAYWDLANVYLDEFPEEMRAEARDMLELCLKNYPNTRRSVLVKCRLVDLYDAKDSRRAELVRQLKNDAGLPSMLKASIN